VRHPLTYRAARRNIVIREAKFKTQWSRFRLVGRTPADMKAIVDFLVAARRQTERAT
jgi:hypothetical protein